MTAALERLVRDRAAGRCEYCRLPQAASGVPFEIDHIIARKHRGRTTAGNLALSCSHSTGKLTRLYHPRRHKRSAHFRYDGGFLMGRSPIGRTTQQVLEVNLPNLVALRNLLMQSGLF